MSTKEIKNAVKPVVESEIGKIITPDFRKLIKDYFDFELVENFTVKLQRLELAVIGQYASGGAFIPDYKYKKLIEVDGKKFNIRKDFWELPFNRSTQGLIYNWSKNPFENSMKCSDFTIQNFSVDSHSHGSQKEQNLETLLSNAKVSATVRFFATNIWRTFDQKKLSFLWLVYQFVIPSGHEADMQNISKAFDSGNFDVITI